jgi:hypothetical protein
MCSNRYFQADNPTSNDILGDATHFLKHGFRTTDFGQRGITRPHYYKSFRYTGVILSGRIFLVSKGKSHSSFRGDKGKLSKPTKTRRNRKKVIFEDSFELNGIIYQVNSVKSGLYENILVRIIEQLEIAGQKWKRVFVYRFDLHSHYYSADNKRVSRFRDRLSKRLQRQYGFKEVNLIWAREREKAKAQHYHCALILDGNLIRHPSNLSRIIKDCWEDETEAHHMPVIAKPYYFGGVDEIREKVIYRLSYLAKARGKGYRGAQSKDYQCSRMKPMEGKKDG